MTLRVTVRKEDLIRTITKNRDKHRSIFEIAIVRYREQVIAEFEKRIKIISSGKRCNTYVNLPEPVDHTRDYNRVLDMLAAHTEGTLTLDQETYANYVDDDWSWKREFVGTVSNYVEIEPDDE